MSLRETTPAVDALIDQWTQDRAVVRTRTLELIRRGHIVMAPLVIAGLFVVAPQPRIVVLGLFFLVAMAVGMALLPPRRQAVALALFDILIMTNTAALDAHAWYGLLVPTVAAITIGWLVSPRVTWSLWLVGCGAMAVAGIAAHVPYAPYTAAVMAGTAAFLNLNNLKILGESRDSVLRVADLVDSLPVIVWEADPEDLSLTRVVGWVEPLLGFTPAVWRDLPVAARVHPDDLARYTRTPDGAGDALVREIRLRRLDGSHLLVREVVRCVSVGDRRYARGVVLDIAEEAAARLAVDRLAAVVDNQAEPLLLIAGRASVAEPPRILAANPAFVRLAGGELTSLGDREVREVAPWLPDVLLADLDAATSAASPRVHREGLEIVAPAGARSFDCNVATLPDGSIAVQFTDVTDRQLATALIRHQAFHDPLTSLPNRALLFDRLAQALAATRRTHSTVGLLLLDLNQFKEINDTLGHGYGDEMLCTIADRLAELVREVDTVAARRRRVRDRGE
ncbi:MAG: diguanylate cyclase [Acidimicrobiales bacterium]